MLVRIRAVISADPSVDFGSTQFLEQCQCSNRLDQSCATKTSKRTGNIWSNGPGFLKSWDLTFRRRIPGSQLSHPYAVDVSTGEIVQVFLLFSTR